MSLSRMRIGNPFVEREPHIRWVFNCAHETVLGDDPKAYGDVLVFVSGSARRKRQRTGAVQDLAEFRGGCGGATASWSAVVLYRFYDDPNAHARHLGFRKRVGPSKAPEDWRSPKPGGVSRRLRLSTVEFRGSRRLTVG